MNKHDFFEPEMLPKSMQVTCKYCSRPSIHVAVLDCGPFCTNHMSDFKHVLRVFESDMANIRAAE